MSWFLAAVSQEVKDLEKTNGLKTLQLFLTTKCKINYSTRMGTGPFKDAVLANKEPLEWYNS